MTYLDKIRALPAADRLVHWITEREKVRLKKEAGEPPPWTDDPILRQYRFCNVRRMDDKVSRWLLTNWYERYFDHPNMLKAVALARFINKPESLEPVTGLVFGKGWPAVRIGAKLRSLPKPLFNAAYVVSTNGRSMCKIEAVLGYVASLDRPGVVVDTGSMENTWSRITNNTYGFGSFMAGQVVADLRWAVTGTWADRNNWAPVGPGSARGLSRLLYDDEWEPQSRAYVSKPEDEWLPEFRRFVLGEVRGRLPQSIRSRLEAHDHQNCLCEFDKYERGLWGQGKPKQLYGGNV